MTSVPASRSSIPLNGSRFLGFSFPSHISPHSPQSHREFALCSPRTSQTCRVTARLGNGGWRSGIAGSCPSMTWFSDFSACQLDSLFPWLYQCCGTLAKCLDDYRIRIIAELGRYKKSEVMARRISQLLLALLCSAVSADEVLKPCGEAYYQASQVGDIH